MTAPSFVQRIVTFVPIQTRRVGGRLRQNFWFLPSVAVVLAIVASELIIDFDRSLVLADVPGFSWASTTPEAARGILTTLVGALTSVTGVVLSMMLLILAQTSSQLGPRVVRTVISGNELQATIATMLATIAFSLTTIRAVRGDEATSAFVPEIATLISVIAFFISLGTLIYFVNHVSQMIQAPHVIARIARELDASITANSYEESTRPRSDLEQERLQILEERTFPVTTDVTADRDGYLQAVDWNHLVELCCEADIVARVPLMTGAFHRSDQAVCILLGESGVSEELIGSVRSCFFFGQRRTPEQDLLAPIMELGEIATRALSPGINDPRTACMCIDRLTSGVRKLAKEWHGRALLLDSDAQPRVTRILPTVANAVDAAFASLAHYGCGDPIVNRQLDVALQDLDSANLPEDASALIRSLRVRMNLHAS